MSLYRKRAHIALAARTAQPIVRALALEGLAAPEARPGLGRHGLAMHVASLAARLDVAGIAPAAHATSSIASIVP